MEIFSAAVLLFLIMDPLGNIPVFLSVLKTVPENRRQHIMLRELCIALAVMLLFLFTGKAILFFLGLDQDSVSIAGGVVLFLIALRMIFPTKGGVLGDGNYSEPFIVPLAIPLMAGPSILATIILLTGQFSGHYWLLMLALLMAWLASAVILLISTRIYRLIGDRGLIAIERLMGMILVMISVQMLIQGIQHAFRSLS